jgi:hypothetical protein
MIVQPDDVQALDVQALMPLLCAMEAEAAVEALATVVAENSRAAWPWIARHRDAAGLRGDDLLDASLHQSSPVRKLAEAQDALSTACWRYRISTGRDGLALARETIERIYGTNVATWALRPLVIAAEAWAEVDDIIASGPPEPLPPEPEPTVEQRRAGARVFAEWYLSDPRFRPLKDSLEALMVSRGAGARDYGPTALEAVRSALVAARDDGVEVEALQIVLTMWTAATGGPEFTLTAEKEPTP